MQDTKSKLPCISHSCKFQGASLKRYLRSKCHILSEKDPRMAESYMRKTFVCCQESTTQSHGKPSKSQQEPSKTQHEKPSQKKQAISVTLSSVTHWEIPAVSTAPTIVKDKKKMPKTSTSNIRLRGVAPDTTPSKYQKLIALRHKKLCWRGNLR